MESRKKIFEEVFRNNRDRVFRLCCMYTGDKEFRKDLMQDIFIRVWENLDSFRHESSLSTWIYRIALNTCLTHVRTLKRNRQVKTLPDQFDVEDSQSGKEENAALDYFFQSVNLLPSFERTLISLYLEDLSGKEIAEITGLTEANVRVKIHRIKEHLNEMITALTIKNEGNEFR